MMIRAWRFLALVLTACSFGMAFCHLMELPAKLGYDARTWLSLQHGLYREFGPPGPGPWLELGAIAAAMVLALLAYGRGAAFWWSVFGAFCLIAAQVIWWRFIA